jgi:response regulator RpfG family c-di-GMP phosphodiesterase
MGYRVYRAGHPQAAIALEANHPGGIDLLVSDIVLPQMDGHALYQHPIPSPTRGGGDVLIVR